VKLLCVNLSVNLWGCFSRQNKQAAQTQWKTLKRFNQFGQIYGVNVAQTIAPDTIDRSRRSALIYSMVMQRRKFDIFGFKFLIK
jgi:hypothetical protein